MTSRHILAISLLAAALIAGGIGLIVSELPPPPEASPADLARRCERKTGEQFEHCAKEVIEIARLQAVLRQMREERARIEACDHRGLFGLWGKNECPHND